MVPVHNTLRQGGSIFLRPESVLRLRGDDRCLVCSGSIVQGLEFSARVPERNRSKSLEEALLLHEGFRV